MTVLLLAAGLMCGPASPPAWLALGTAPYRIGDHTVIVLQTRAEVDTACRLRGGQGRSIHGCYIYRDRTIITTPDFWVLLHEMKHALEPDWIHE